MPAIETKNLTKYYLHGKILGVSKLDLSINEGEIFGFIGPNGAGKSTTIRLLLDLIRPTSGTATIFDLDINKDSVKIKEEIGFLPGEIFLPENMTGRECINYYKGFKKKVESSYLKRLAENFDFDASKRISDYSKGNKQKLAIILAMMHKPRLLILDEPTSGLDPLNQQTFYNEIEETKKWGTTTFFSTHILTEAEKLCDRVGVIKAGKLLKIESTEDFRGKNIRDIQLETTATIPLSKLQFEGVRQIKRTTNGYRITFVGKNGSIVNNLHGLPIDDIKIGEPSLEDIFMHFYS